MSRGPEISHRSSPSRGRHARTTAARAPPAAIIRMPVGGPSKAVWAATAQSAPAVMTSGQAPSPRRREITKAARTSRQPHTSAHTGVTIWPGPCRSRSSPATRNSRQVEATDIDSESSRLQATCFVSTAVATASTRSS